MQFGPIYRRKGPLPWQSEGVPQPDFVPARPLDRVRPTERIPVPDRWVPGRPGDISTTFQPSGDQLGSQGPDQGYGIKLARRFVKRFKLTAGEHVDDVVAGGLAVALKRASIFGRAPVVYDFELAFSLWGYLGDAPDELIAVRKDLFAEASHHYEAQRAIADAVPEATLRKTPKQVADGNWKELVSL